MTFTQIYEFYPRLTFYNIIIWRYKYVRNVSKIYFRINE